MPPPLPPKGERGEVLALLAPLARCAAVLAARPVAESVIALPTTATSHFWLFIYFALKFCCVSVSKSVFDMFSWISGRKNEFRARWPVSPARPASEVLRPLIAARCPDHADAVLDALLDVDPAAVQVALQERALDALLSDPAPPPTPFGQA